MDEPESLNDTMYDSIQENGDKMTIFRGEQFSAMVFLQGLILLGAILDFTSGSGMTWFFVSFSILTLPWLVLYGRTFCMDAEGCTVSFLWFRTKYRWEDLQIRQALTGLRNRIHLGRNAPSFECAVVFSPHSFSIPGWIGLESYLHFLTMFQWTKSWSLVYLYLAPRDCASPVDKTYYTVDSELFWENMKAWGITIQNAPQ